MIEINLPILKLDDAKDFLLIKIENENVVDLEFYDKTPDDDYKYYGILDLEEDRHCAIEDSNMVELKYLNSLIDGANKMFEKKREYFIRILKEYNDKNIAFAREHNLFSEAIIERMEEDFNKELSR